MIKSIQHPKKVIVGLALFSTLISILFLNRWIFTNVPISSFARVWQYYVDYEDVGFARRLLVGSILSISQIRDLFHNEFLFSHIFYSLCIIVLCSIFLHYILRRPVNYKPYQFIPVFFSPFFILQMGATTGTQDIILLIIAAASIFYIKRLRIFLIVSLMGLLVHDIYILMLPALLLIHAIRHQQKIFSTSYLSVGLILILAFLFIVTFMKIDMAKTSYEELVSQKIPLAAYQHSLWSGYFELSTTVKENFIEGGGQFLKRYTRNFHYTIIPTIYLILLVLSVSFQNYQSKNIKNWMIFTSLLIPLLASIFAIDYYRWLGMSANLSIIFMVYLLGENQFYLKKWQWIVLILGGLLAPFGGNEMHIPFPLHQPMIQKLWM